MPTYDYICDACSHHLEIFHSMSESARKKCPACGKLKLVRQIGSGGGVIFKGAGFYETEYRSDSYKKGESAAESASKSASKPAPKASPKGDSSAAGE